MTNNSSMDLRSPWLVSINEGGCHFRWRRQGDEIVAEWVGVLSLHVDANGTATFTPAPDVDPHVASKTMRAGGTAFVRALQGQISLHGSAVARAGTALVCLGTSGAGKSTAAAELCSEGEFTLFSDDAVALEFSSNAWWVLPTESVNWLSIDGAPRKAPVAAPALGSAPAKLATLVSLHFDASADRPRVERLRGAEAYAVLSSSALRFEARDELRTRELDRLASIASHAPIYRVLRPARSCAADTAKLLEDLVEKSA